MCQLPIINPKTINNSPIEYVNITKKWVCIIEFLLNLAKNSVESDIKNNKAPITVIRGPTNEFMAIPVASLKIANTFIDPLNNKYPQVGMNNFFLTYGFS